MVARLRGEDPPGLDIDLGDNGVDAMDDFMFREAIWPNTSGDKRGIKQHKKTFDLLEEKRTNGYQYFDDCCDQLGMMVVLLVEKIVARKLEKNNVMLLLRQLVWMVGMGESELHRAPSVHRTVGSTAIVVKGFPLALL